MYYFKRIKDGGSSSLVLHSYNISFDHIEGSREEQIPEYTISEADESSHSTLLKQVTFAQ